MKSCTYIYVLTEIRMTPSYLIYHPKRKETIIGNLKVYHDKLGGNEDPYIWHDKFLHTYCHITQLTNEKGQINFWVSGDAYPNFTKLFCDCVFVVDSKCLWKDQNNIDCSNNIDRSNSIVDNDQTFEHHYKWANPSYKNHPLKKRQRYTLKADSRRSFQPQDSDKNLIDIIPFLKQQGISTDKLIKSIAMTSNGKKSINSRPFLLDNDIGQKLYDYLFKAATIKLFGKQLKSKHPKKNTKNENCC
jgi:hypothetical protein